MISIIVAASENDAIGIDQHLPWRLSADLKHFKALTTGHVVVMGRKTFESLPNGALPNRQNVVLTSQSEANFPNCHVFGSWEEMAHSYPKEEELFIIGGATLYRQALSVADRLYLTRVHHSFMDADTFLPPVDWSEWTLQKSETFPADTKNEYPYSFETYVRKEK